MGHPVQPERASEHLSNALLALLPLALVGLWRCAVWLFLAVGRCCYRVQAPRADDKWSTSQVSVIVPTIDGDEASLLSAIRTWVLNEPLEIVIVTVEGARKTIQAIVDKSAGADITRVVVSPAANKRTQLVVGIEASVGALACFTDDDAIWSRSLLRFLLAPFNDDRMGGTGSNQIMRPSGRDARPTPFERIANMRLSERMFEGGASTFYDGSVSCLSGRTALYHKRVLEPREVFEEAFCNEYWGSAKLMSGDDKFLTRWLVSRGWRMRMQLSPECTLETTFRPDGAFLKQVLRWARNTWRSDLKSLVLEHTMLRRYPVQAFLMADRMIAPLTLCAGPVLFAVALALTWADSRWPDRAVFACVYGFWLLMCHTCRLLPHLLSAPEDALYVPLFIAYQYFFALLKFRAVFTLGDTAWGTRSSGNDPQASPRTPRSRAPLLMVEASPRRHADCLSDTP